MPSTFADKANQDPQANTEVTEVAAQNQGQQPDQSVALIVGERAFATMEDVKTKIVNADSHITDIETENAQLRAQLEEANTKVATAESLEEVLNNKEGFKEDGLTQDQIKDLVGKQVGTLRADEVTNSNRAQCIGDAEKAYGENFIVKMQEIATSVGLTMDDVDEMAGGNPRLFANTFLPTPRVATSNATHTSTIRTSNFQDTPSGPEVKPVLSLNSKDRAAQYLRQLEALTN